ncbi:hypothetical protein MRX96_046571 [Rhipicephalus microplus]
MALRTWKRWAMRLFQRTTKGAEKANGEELTEVEEKIIGEEAEESQKGEGKAEECECCEEEIGKRDGEEAEESQDLEEDVETRDDEEDMRRSRRTSEEKVAWWERPLKTGKQPAMGRSNITTRATARCNRLN